MRQCRDRFNLLYNRRTKRSVKDFQSSSQNELKELLQRSFQTFDFNPEGNIILREAAQAPSTSSAQSSQLTAAHCKEDMSDTPIMVRQQSSRITTSVQDVDDMAQSPGEENICHMIHKLTLEISAIRSEVSEIKQILIENPAVKPPHSYAASQK